MTADSWRVADDLQSTAAVTVSRYRRIGLRMSCWSCEVAWTGAADSTCWVCEAPGIPGPPPSIYPDLD